MNDRHHHYFDLFYPYGADDDLPVEHRARATAELGRFCPTRAEIQARNQLRQRHGAKVVDSRFLLVGFLIGNAILAAALAIGGGRR